MVWGFFGYKPNKKSCNGTMGNRTISCGCKCRYAAHQQVSGWLIWVFVDAKCEITLEAGSFVPQLPGLTFGLRSSPAFDNTDNTVYTCVT